jgi:Uma2 family endonuclease
MSEMASEYKRRPITVAEYHRLGKIGFFAPEERVELLDGELILMPPIGWDHTYSCAALTQAFVLRFAGRAILMPSGAVTLDDYSEPQPDFLVLKGSLDRHPRRLPVPGDVALVVEVSNTSLRMDRNRKSKAYARAGIPEYWIVDLVNDLVEVRRDPRGDTYESIRVARRGESLELEAFPGETFEVDAFLR